MISFLIAFFGTRNESDKGATAVEYGLMLALIAVAIIGAVSLLGDQINTMFDNVKGALSDV